MAINAVNKFTSATKTGVKTGVKTIKAARGHSEHAAELRRQLGMSALLAGIAGTLGFLALRAMQKANQKASDHLDWKSEDKKLDRALETTLDASDPIAKY